MNKTNEEIQQWEKTETERSATDAKHYDNANLAINETQVERYMNPPQDTVYPLEYAYNLLGDVKDKTVLDFGCGAGENTVLLGKRGAKIIGLDISEDLINIARQRLQVNNIDADVDFVVCSAHNIDLPDESVDVVFGIAILHHLDLLPVACEVYRVLRKGGRAIFLEPVRNSKLIKFVRSLIPYQSPDVSPFERPLTDGELKDFAKEFSEYKSKAFMLPFINLATVIPGTNRLIHPLYRIDGKILKAIPSLSYYGSIRVIEMVK